MPGMPVFQEFPSQLKGQIFVLNTTTDELAPLSVDDTGSLSIIGSVDLDPGAEVALAAGAEVALAAGTEVGLTAGTEVALAAGTEVDLAAGAEVALAAGTEVGLAAGTEVGLAAGTEVDLAAGAEVALAAGTEVGLAAGTEVDLAAGAEVALATGSNIIGRVESQRVFTNVDSFGGVIPLTPEDVNESDTVISQTQNVSLETSYNWFIRNIGDISSDQDITLVVEISPDEVIWLQDTGANITVEHNTSKMITVTNFLQYIRFVITGGAADTQVISCFQAQH